MCQPGPAETSTCQVKVPTSEALLSGDVPVGGGHGRSAVARARRNSSVLTLIFGSSEVVSVFLFDPWKRASTVCVRPRRLASRVCLSVRVKVAGGCWAPAGAVAGEELASRAEAPRAAARCWGRRTLSLSL